jgi:molybdate transport system substrate-binding protein
MKQSRVIAALVSILLPLFVLKAQGAELKVSASGAVKAALEQLGPEFEKASGNKLVLGFYPTALLKKQIDDGAAFDVAILTASLTDALTKSGKIQTGSVAAVARGGLGVSVRAGSSKPDVSTDQALKSALLNAKSIGYNGAGASRAGNEAMFRKLGVADAVQPKVKLLDVSAPIAVDKGEVEVGLGPISEILPVSGVQFAGPFPADVQSYLVFAAGVSSSSKNSEAAKALIKFLTSPEAASVIKVKGMEPG